MTSSLAARDTEFGQSCASSSFVALKAERFRLVRVLLALYLMVYLGTSVLCGFDRALAGVKVIGPLNLGYALIIGNYAVAWALAFIYLRRSTLRLDPMAAAAIAERAEHSAPVRSLAA